MTINEKYEKLKETLRGLGSVAVAFSGGVDSTFLLKTAYDVLGGGALAVTARACFFPEREQKEAAAFCGKEGIRLICLDVNMDDIDGFAQNPPNRCYICKKYIFTRLCETARRQGITRVAEGSNADDMNDYRPGMAAVTELGVLSPLKDAGLTKAEIRELSERAGLPTYDKPSLACLATRFPYGGRITAEALKMAEQAEDFLFGSGFKQVRARCHGDTVRIETDENGFALLSDPALRGAVYEKLKSIGFAYVSLDLRGYRMGSMNEGVTAAG